MYKPQQILTENNFNLNLLQLNHKYNKINNKIRRCVYHQKPVINLDLIFFNFLKYLLEIFNLRFHLGYLMQKKGKNLYKTKLSKAFNQQKLVKVNNFFLKNVIKNAPSHKEVQ